MLKIKSKKIFFVVVLFISIFLNIVFIRIDIYPQIKQKISEDSNHYISPNIKASLFRELILNGAKKRLEAQYVVDNGLSNSSSFKDRLKKDLLSQNISVYDYGEQGHLMWYTIQVAISNKDEQLIKFIKSKFDNVFLSTNNIISKTDQAIYGCVAIELYKLTKDNRYKDFSNKIFLFLKGFDDKYGLICYRVGLEQQVDLLGFVCPFLSEYGRTFASKKATELSAKLIDNYAKFGVDERTGIPVQGYNLKSKIKTGYANWGRGISWYIIAVSSVNKKELNLDTRHKIEIFTETLNKIMNDGLITQFPGHSKIIDMSATLPVIYFLHKESRITINSSDFIKKVAPFIHDDGLVGFNSPSITSGAAPVANLYHDMSQGMLVILFNKIN